MLITDEERRDFVCAKCKNSPPPIVEFLLLTDQDLLNDKLQENDKHEEQKINIDFGLQNFNPDMENCGLNSPQNSKQKADLTGMPDFPDIHDEDFLLAEELLANFDFIFDLD